MHTVSLLPRRIANSSKALSSTCKRTLFKNPYVKSPNLTREIPSYLLNMPQTKLTTLSNGLVVATEEAPLQTTTVYLQVLAGSVFEDAKNNGVAHFLEHMAFKGTPTRSRHAIEREIENMGATLNAFTSREIITFAGKSFKSNLPAITNIIADIVQNSKYDESDIETERKIILREYQEVNNQLTEASFDQLHAAAFQGTSLGTTILGTPDNIQNIQRSDLIDFVKTFYSGQRMILTAVGGVNHDEFVKIAEKEFGNLTPGNNFHRDIETDYTGSMVVVRNDDMPLAHILLAVQGVCWSDPDFYVAQILQVMMGSWDRAAGGNANLVSRIAEVVATHGLAHSITAFSVSYGYTGLIGNSMICPPAEIDRCITEVTNEWQRLANSSTRAEVERAKNKLKGALLLSLDSPDVVCEEIGRQMLTIGRRLPLAEVICRIDDITVQDVRRVASKFFTDVSPVVVAIGPVDDLPDYSVIRSWTYWNRL